MSIVLIFVIVVLVLYFIKSKYKVYLTGYHLTGPLALPLIGNVQMISKMQPEYLFLNITENRTKYRQSYRLWLGPELWVFLHSPKETRDALNDNSLVRADTFQQLRMLLGNGLLISKGKIWETHRHALVPAFHNNILSTFVATLGVHADFLVDKINENLNQSIEASDYIFPCILDMIIDTSMGTNINSQQDPNGTYTRAFHNAAELLFKRMVNPLLASDFIFKFTKMHHELKTSVNVVHELIESIIKTRASYIKSENSAHKPKQQTLIDTLLTTEINGQPLSFQDIFDEVNTFLFAGVDTTTAAMSFILYALAKFPEEQKLVFEEIQRYYQQNKIKSFEHLTLNQLNSLEYLDLFIKECLRYYTIVPMTGRQTTRDTKIGNKSYCAGVTLWVNMYGLAHDDELFEAPNEFRPLRFSESHGGKNILLYSYIPFGGGSHICIGRKYASMIMKILTVKLVENFEIVLNNPDEKLVLLAQMVLKSLNGINLKFKRRT